MLGWGLQEHEGYMRFRLGVKLEMYIAFRYRKTILHGLLYSIIRAIPIWQSRMYSYRYVQAEIHSKAVPSRYTGIGTVMMYKALLVLVPYNI